MTTFQFVAICLMFAALESQFLAFTDDKAPFRVRMSVAICVVGVCLAVAFAASLAVGMILVQLLSP